MSPLYRIFERILDRILPKQDSDRILSDIAGQPIRKQIEYFVDLTKSTIGTRYRRRIYFTVKERDALSLKQRYALMEKLYRLTCRMNTNWLIGYFVLASTNSFILPDVYKIDFWSPILTAVPICVVLFIYRDSFFWSPKGPELSSTISVESYKKVLQKWYELLLTNFFSPRETPVQALWEAVLFVWASAIPVIVMVRWVVFDVPVARDGTWVNVWFRMTFCFAVLVLWMLLKGANRIAADIFDHEIKVVGAESAAGPTELTIDHWVNFPLGSSQPGQ